MSSTFTLKDWTVYGLSDETAAASFNATTNTLTLSPSFTDSAPVVYEFYDNLFDTSMGTVRNDLRFNLDLKMTNNTDTSYSNVTVDTVTMHPINVAGDTYHPTLAHFHPADNPGPATLTQFNAYSIQQGETYGSLMPNLNGATRAHLFGNTMEPGETESWTAAKVHHWDGVFALVVTPTSTLPYGDVGNRLQGLDPAAPASGSQFAYQNVVNQHYSGAAVEGTATNDLLVGSDGESVITGGNGRDTALGRDGNDAISGGDGDDFLYGQRGLDTLTGGDGNDLLDGGADADMVEGWVGDDMVLGGAGNDIVYGGDGDDTADGGLDDDIVDGGFGNDIVGGGYGNDMVYGGYGDDRLYGYWGNDTLRGGFGADTLFGGENNDRLNGEDGADALFGGFGSDTLNGAGGEDTLYGGTESDLIVGDGGRDHLYGGSEADRFDFNFLPDSGTGANRDVIEDFNRTEGDKFDVAGIDARLNAGSDNDTFTFIGSNGFGGVAGQLRYADGVVQADVNGDRNADFEVQIVGAPPLQLEDFIL
ncbi:MAG TPA: calcium-binding protein [Azospirillum sp.]|nr:calcium-binding protein [Azospirillum sp.]